MATDRTLINFIFQIIFGDTTGNIYAVDGLNNRVQKWCLSKHRTTMAGGNGSGLTLTNFIIPNLFLDNAGISILLMVIIPYSKWAPGNYKQQWLEEMDQDPMPIN
jgi:hypothetical protein